MGHLKGGGFGIKHIGVMSGPAGPSLQGCDDERRRELLEEITVPDMFAQKMPLLDASLLTHHTTSKLIFINASLHTKTALTSPLNLGKYFNQVIKHLPYVMPSRTLGCIAVNLPECKIHLWPNGFMKAMACCSSLLTKGVFKLCNWLSTFTVTEEGIESRPFADLALRYFFPSRVTTTMVW